MNADQLFAQIQKKQSFLCVGLDPHEEKIPATVFQQAKETGEDPIVVFNRAIIEATQDLCVAYKPNLAFYESRGIAGWKALEETLKLIPEEQYVIADAKRGDIGNTSKMYAKTFFETYAFDAVTVAPYMGEDSVTPFQVYPDKWVILLALTSNQGALDFQMLSTGEKPLYAEVVTKSQEWGTTDNLMYVVGATRGELIGEVRALAPDHFFLVPGVGKQGGSLEEVAQFGLNSRCGLLVNSSRGIIHASSEADFATRAREEAQKLQEAMSSALANKGLLST